MPFDRAIVHREQAALMLLSLGMSCAEAARRIGVVPSTVSRWARRPEFSRRLEQINRDLGPFITEHVKGVYAKSVDTVAEGMDATVMLRVKSKDDEYAVETDVPDWPTRLRAASLIQSVAHARAGLQPESAQAVSESELEAKLQRVEQRIAQRQAARRADPLEAEGTVSPSLDEGAGGGNRG